MELISLFLNTSWKSIALAVLTGLLSGASSAGIIAVINTIIRGTNIPKGILAVGFLALCLSFLVSTAISQIYISRLAERIIFNLRLRLTRQILACPLRDLEEIGIPRLLSTLTQDIEVIAINVNQGAFSTTSLSQGQRKRLALLTAYLEDRAIYIFDEWASDQDPAFKKIFYTQLLPELKKRAKGLVVVSHDDHYFDQADRIVKLDYGKVEYDHPQRSIN